MTPDPKLKGQSLTLESAASAGPAGAHFCFPLKPEASSLHGFSPDSGQQWMREGPALYGSLERGCSFVTRETMWAAHSSLCTAESAPPHLPQRKGFLKTIRVLVGRGGDDNNLRRRCEAFLSEHFQACGRLRLRCQVLLRGVLGPLGLQGRPRARGKGEREEGKERQRGREKAGETHTQSP